MKRIVTTVMLCAFVSMAFAQKKAVKEAKKALESNKISEARELIKPALTDPETANDPETWKIAGDIENKAFDNEVAKMVIGEQPNDEAMYQALYNSYDPYVKADQISQTPNEKGKIQDKYRKQIAPIMKVNQLYYINGGVFYTNTKKDPATAIDYFQRYLDLPKLDMFKNNPETSIEVNDTLVQTVKYYAAISAIQAKEHQRAIGFLNDILTGNYIPTDDVKEAEVYELLVSEYIQVGDSAKYIATLEEGSKKFPNSEYMIRDLINIYIRTGKLEQALANLDQAIANDPANACELYSVKASIYTQIEDYDNSFNSYEKAMAANPDCDKALEGLAVAYIVKAQDLKEKASQASLPRKEQTEMDEEANELYRKAYPLLEKLRQFQVANGASVPQLKSTLFKLRNAYYNLNMNDEYDEVEKAYEELPELE